MKGWRLKGFVERVEENKMTAKSRTSRCIIDVDWNLKNEQK